MPLWPHLHGHGPPEHLPLHEHQRHQPPLGGDCRQRPPRRLAQPARPAAAAAVRLRGGGPSARGVRVLRADVAQLVLVQQLPMGGSGDANAGAWVFYLE